MVTIMRGPRVAWRLIALWLSPLVVAIGLPVAAAVVSTQTTAGALPGTALSYGYISTFAGSGSSTYSGDGGAATSAGFADPVDAVSDASGNVYVSDSLADVVRKVDTSGTITLFAGTVNTAGFSGDGGAATSAKLSAPKGLAVGSDGSVYIADFNNARVRKVNPSGTISTIAGNGFSDVNGGDGDGGAATSAKLNPFGLAFDSAGNLYASDWDANRVRKIDTSGNISTVAGSGTPSSPGYSGDGSAATSAQLDEPRGIAVDGSGNLFIADTSNEVVRKVNTGGIISTFAGDHTPNCPLGGIANRGDGLFATDANVQLNPWWVTTDRFGSVYISDYLGARVRRVDASGVISTVAGSGSYLCNGSAGFSGDNGPAGLAKLQNPYGISIDGQGNLILVDEYNYRIRAVWGAIYATPTQLETRVPNPSELGYCRACAADPVDGASGNFYESYTDLAIPGRSPGLDETRTYGSLNASYNGPFGYGWSSSYDMHLQLGSGAPASTVDVVQENDAFASFTWNGTQYVAPPRVLATLVLNGDGTYTFTRRAQEQFVFDSTGLLIKEVARNGFAGSPGPGVVAAYTTTLAYSSGVLSTVTDAAGRTLTFSYGTNGKVSGIADSTGRSVGYGYDGSGNLTDVTDVASGNTHFGYDGSHLLLTARDPRVNTVTTNTYDATGRTLTQEDALMRTTTMDYTSVPGSTKVTDPKGNVTIDAFVNNMLMSATKGSGTSAVTWTYTYDPSTLGVATETITSSSDPNNHQTSYTWDPSGHPLTATDALNHETIWTYNAFGEPLTVEDAKLVTTTNTYDSAGNLTSTSTPLVEQPGQTQTTTYTHGDSAHPGDVTSITDPRSKIWSFGYDASTGDLLSQTTPLGDETTYTYNSAGQRLTMVTPNGNVTGGNPSQYTTTYVPDAFGDDTSVTDPLTHQTQYVYDADRNLHQVIDPLTQTTTYDYDVANQLTTVTRPDTTQLHNDYWPDGTLKTQTDAAGNATSYAYDALARLASVTDPKNRATSYTYDAAGNVKTVLDPASRTTTSGCDVADRLTSVTYSDGVTPNVAYTYDADNQRLTMSDGTSPPSSSYTWDSLHRLTSQTDGASQTMGYGYDLANNLTSITYPGSHTVTRGYDDSGRIHTVADWLTHTTTYNYDHNSNLITQAYPNSTLATYTPDAANRLMNIADTKSGPTFASFGYGRNGNDLLTSTTPTGVGQSNETYGYSTLNQLNSVNGSSYTFDAADNLTGMPSGTKLAYDNANELCWTATTTGTCASPPTGATTYSYGASGERTGMTPPTGNPTIGYAYDQAYRLTSIQGAGYRTAVLASNPLGYWRLGEASGTTAADSSGYAQTGTYSNVTLGAGSALTTDANTAATFNGTSSNVVLPASSSFDFSSTKKFTLEAWVKATVGGPIIARGLGGGGEQYTLDTSSSGYRFFVRCSGCSAVRSTSADGHTTSGSASISAADGAFTTTDIGRTLTGTGIPANTTIASVQSGTAVTLTNAATATATNVVFAIAGNSTTIIGPVAGTAPNGTWQHVVAIFDQPAGRMELWLNGAKIGTATPPTTLVGPTSNPTIGARKSSNTDTGYGLVFNGSLDEAAIYPAALSSAQIVNHYQAAKSNYAGTTTANAPTADWRLGETSGTAAADAAGNGHTGTYTGGYTLSQAGALTGDTDKAVKFNGTSAYVSAGNLGMGALSTFTVEAWIKTTSTTNSWIVAEGSTTSTTPVAGLLTATSGSKAEFAVRDNAGTLVAVTGVTTINSSGTTWHHLVGVRNGSTLSLYVDGKLDGTATGTGGHPGTITLNTTTIGAMHQSTVNAYFNGTVDEAAYYPTSLDAATVARHYYNGTNSSPTVAAYTYNGDGNRTSKTVDGINTQYTWDTAQGVPLLASDGTNQYIYGPGGVPLEYVNISNSAVTYYHQDQQGSTRALTDQSGNVIATFTTDAFGNPTASAGTAQTPLRYDGEYRDSETGFIYLRARYYDPATAQFLTRDAADVVTRSAYGYGGNDPFNNIDPTGMNFLSDAVSSAYDSAASTVSSAYDSTVSAVASVLPDCPFGSNPDGSCRGSDVEHDAAVVGEGLGIAGLAAGAVLAPEVELPLLGLVSSEGIGLGLTASSLAIGAVVTAADCNRDANAECVIEGFSVATGAVGLGGGLAFSSFGPLANLGDLTEYGGAVSNYVLGGLYSLGFGAATLFGTQLGLDPSDSGCW